MQVIIVKAEVQFVMYDSGIIKMIDCNTGLSVDLIFTDGQMKEFMELQRQYQSGMITIGELINGVYNLNR